MEVLEFATPADVRAAFEVGQIDVMCGTLVEVLMIRDAAGITPKIVLVTDYSAGADVVLARPELPLIDAVTSYPPYSLALAKEHGLVQVFSSRRAMRRWRRARRAAASSPA
ncbi:MAG: hypothetical protein EXR69_14795 [Myxococcales bacterium]|nr:hypothetical protein [Myxococcales bacterium]